MSLAVAYSRGRSGVDAPLVTVEVHISNGLPALNLVGLPEAAVKESKDRVRGAIINSHFQFPMQRITINLAPADVPKEGGRFDLPIALGILAASGQISTLELAKYECIGELSLGGDLRSVNGVLPVALQAREANRALFLPLENAQEAALVQHAELFPAQHLLAICAHLNGQQRLPTQLTQTPSSAAHNTELDFADVQGQFRVKRALEIAATGLHNRSKLCYNPHKAIKWYFKQ